MADTEILQAIRIIDDKIASLQEARDRLASAFGVESATPIKNPIIATVRSLPVLPSPLTPTVRTSGDSRPRGRKEELAEFLVANGAMSRQAIMEKAGLPEGTISYCLADKRFFEQLENGDWSITDFSRRGLDRRAKTGHFHLEQD